MYRIIVAVALFLPLAIFVPKIFSNMKDDLLDANKFAARMNEAILDDQRCSKFKAEIRQLGSNAGSVNGGLSYAVGLVKQAANKEGCSKSNS
jgi:hypothetical protein